jgi:hypothetical protein
MLVEFALTPSVFDQAVNDDLEEWRTNVRVLGLNMFPRTGSWPVMVSNLHSGSWYQIASEIAKSITDSTARMLCESLLKQATSMLVDRPAVSDWPAEDAVLWCKEAIASHSAEPIDRIIACKLACGTLASECDFLRAVAEVQDSGFWDNIASTWPQKLQVADQVAALRKICVHSQFLCLITPYIRGAGDDETEFAMQLVRSAYRRPTGYRTVDIEIHTQFDVEKSDPNFQRHLLGVRADISKAFKQVLLSGQRVRLVLWPKLLDRFIIAGVLTESSEGRSVRSSRWGIGMQHIARKPDDNRASPPTTWSLLPRKQVGDEFARYCSGTVLGCVDDSTVTA